MSYLIFKAMTINIELTDDQKTQIADQVDSYLNDNKGFIKTVFLLANFNDNQFLSRFDVNLDGFINMTIDDYNESIDNHGLYLNNSVFEVINDYFLTVINGWSLFGDYDKQLEAVLSQLKKAF